MRKFLSQCIQIFLNIPNGRYKQLQLKRAPWVFRNEQNQDENLGG